MRGSRVVAAARGTCRGVITCPFHAWSYNLDGSLRGVARPQTLPVLVVPGGGHFFHGQLPLLRELVLRHLRA